MKTALVTTCFLDVEDYRNKTKRFVNYYINDAVDLNLSSIILFDNASKYENIKECGFDKNFCVVQRFTEHLSRTSHLEYPYLWRAVYYLKDVLKEYDKVIYMDNDFYLTSKNIIEYVNNLNTGWTTFWNPKHRFPETGCHIICKDSTAYNNFINELTEEEFIKKYNGLTMETHLPVDKVETKFTGDRYSEYPLEIPSDADFSAQTILQQKVIYHE